jgi:hypothetical protein
VCWGPRDTVCSAYLFLPCSWHMTPPPSRAGVALRLFTAAGLVSLLRACGE